MRIISDTREPSKCHARPQAAQAQSSPPGQARVNETFIPFQENKALPPSEWTSGRDKRIVGSGLNWDVLCILNSTDIGWLKDENEQRVRPTCAE